MNRRDFILSSLASAVGMTYDLDQLLWVPGAKKIFIPPPARVIRFPRLPLIDVTSYLDPSDPLEIGRQSC